METRWYIVQEESGYIWPLPFTKFHPAVGSNLPTNRPEHQELGIVTVLAAVDDKAFLFLERASENDNEVVSALLWAGICAGTCKAGLKQKNGTVAPRSKTRPRTLTKREHQVLKLLASGNTVKDIARHFNLSVKTIEVHKFNLMRKLRIHNRAELVRYAIEKGVVKLSAG